jgi:hypothetical protein
MGRRVTTGATSGTQLKGTLQVDTVRMGTGSLQLGTGGLTRITEAMVTKTGATGTVVHDFTESQIWWHSSMSASFTANLTNVPTTNNSSVAITFILLQGATGYYPSGIQIAGSAQTIRWLGNTVPTPTSSAGRIDVATFNLLRESNTWYVTGILQAFA